jgi:membrane fusion protein (multidrug efflux system)
MIAKRGILRLIALAALVAGGWFAFKLTIVPTVVVTPVRRGDALLSATGNVKVVPAMDARVVAPAQGILTKFKLKEGDPVKKGDVIAEIDQGNYPFRLKENELDLARIDQRLRLGSTTDLEFEKRKKAFETNQELANAGRIAPEIMEQSRRELAQLEFTISQEKGDLKLARDKVLNAIAEIRQEIDRRTVKAGYDGVIMAPVVLQGDQIFTGGGICNITSLSKVVTAEVNQDDLTAVDRCFETKKPVLVRLFSQGDKIFTGTVTYVNRIGDPKTQRFGVTIDLPDLPNEVRSGQTGEATFIADKHENSLLIPRKALNGGVCLVLKGDRLDQRKVKIGYTTVTDAEIIEGLHEGDLVVAQDVDLYRDNEKVKVRDAQAKDAAK